MTKLSNALPKDNGLSDLNALMINNTEKTYLVVGILKPTKITTNLETGDAEATASFHRLEVVTGQDLTTADQLVRRAIERRTGMVELPIETEDELKQLLSDVIDPDTGELKGDQ